MSKKHAPVPHRAPVKLKAHPAPPAPWSHPQLQPVVAAIDARRFQEAFARLQTLCADTVTDAGILSGAAHLAGRLGQPQQALNWHERALAIVPSAPLRFAYLAAILAAGDLARAERETRAALAKTPQACNLTNLLGVIVRRADRQEEAIGLFMAAARLEPSNPSPWLNQGNAQMALKRYEQAEACYARASQLGPQEGEHFRLLGLARLELKRFDEAITALERALAIGRPDPRVYIDLSHVHHTRQDPETALTIIDQGIARFPGDTSLLRQRGSILRGLSRHAEAKAQFDAILARLPNDVETLVRLGNLYLWGLHQRELANATYERVLALSPGHLETARNYCESLTNSRYGDETAHFQRAYEIACALTDQIANPIDVANSVQGVLLRACDYDRIERLGPPRALIDYFAKDNKVNHLHNQLGRVVTMDDRLALRDAHLKWGRYMEGIAARRPLPVRSHAAPRKQGKVRIGIMSSDLCDHPVGYFAQPILEGYDRDRFELYCYSFRTTPPDRVQQHFAAQVDRFNVIGGQSDREIAARIAADDLDILFELGGLTMLNKLNVCAWRPAPVQVSWLGYPHSAGLSSIDYILVDPYNHPTRGDLITERPFLMPHTWVALGSIGFSEAAPIEPGLPETRTGHLTFGTANNPYKFTRAAFAAWAKVMRATPGSRFLFLRPEANARGFRENVCRHFAAQGIAAERIEFVCVRGRHKPYYNRIDIALDPFPHVGGTTTCESLWMGVPTVTLAGAAFFERLSASNLSNAGLSDLCAATAEDYVQIATGLAADRPRRHALRHGLRDQIRAHPLGQSERFVRDFEATTLHTLNEHGRTAAPEHAEVTPPAFA